MRVSGVAKAFILALLIAGLASACSAGGSGSLAIDMPAPDFKLLDNSGQNVALSASLGKVVVVNFWASTCQPCRDEMPYFQALYSRWRSAGVVFLPIDIGENVNTVTTFLQSNGLNFPVLLDTQGEVAGKYGVQFTPTTLFIDRQGKLKSKVVGAFCDQLTIQNHLASLLN